MTTEMRDICVVGASLAGLRSVQALRKHGHDGRITLVGAEPQLPYDRPPLSKQVLSGEWQPDRIVLADEADLKALDVDVRLGVAAVGLDLANRTVALAAGPDIRCDGLVVATGASPRTLALDLPGSGVLSLRTLDDCLELRAYLQDANPCIVIVGGGFIGLEVAAVCRSAGAEVVVVEALAQPLARVLGEDIGRACARWHEEHGVRIRTGVAVRAFLGRDRLTAVELTDGRILPADVAVVGVGVEPAVGSGLTLDHGVVCNTASVAAPGVVAVGDVARFHHRGHGRAMRIEHWTNASEQAEVATHNLLAGADHAKDYVPTPYFWSDQFGKRLQFVGIRDPDDEVIVNRVGGAPDFTALFCRGDVLHGALAFGSPREFLRLRRIVTDGGTAAAARAVLAR
jgi:3-phenylpropionate/trans-cinnamate dioxygenase ferredoxin reductase subunit